MEVTNHINLLGYYITEYNNVMDLTHDILY